MKKIVASFCFSLSVMGAVQQQTEITDLLRVPQTILSKDSTRVWVPRDISGKQMLMVEGNFKDESKVPVEIDKKIPVPSNTTKRISFLPVDALGASIDLSNPSPDSPYFAEEIFTVPFDNALHQTPKSFQVHDLIPAKKIHPLPENSVASFPVAKRNTAMPIDFVVVKIPATRKVCSKVFVTASGNLIGHVESKLELTTYLIRVKQSISSVEIANGCGFPISLKKVAAYQVESPYTKALEGESAHLFEELQIKSVLLEPRNKSEKLDLETGTGAYLGLIVQTKSPNARVTIDTNEGKKNYFELFDKPDTHFRIVNLAVPAKRIQISNESDAGVTIHRAFIIHRFPSNLTYPFYNKDTVDIVRLRPKDGEVALYIAREIKSMCEYLSTKVQPNQLVEIEKIKAQALALEAVAREHKDLSDLTIAELRKLKTVLDEAKGLMEFLGSVEDYEFFPLQIGKLKEFIESKTVKKK